MNIKYIKIYENCGIVNAFLVNIQFYLVLNKASALYDLLNLSDALEL